MAAVAHAFPSLATFMGTKSADYTSFSASTHLQVGLITAASPAFTWNSTSETVQFISGAAGTGFLGGSGAGALTEVSGGGYSRQTLTSVTITNTGTVATLTCANPSWTSATWSATYAFFADVTTASDATSPVLCYWDFGGTQTVTAATFTLTINGSGLITWTSS